MLPHATKTRSGMHPEEAVIYGLLVVIGIVPVAIVLASGATWAGRETLGLMMVVAGLLGFLVRSQRHPVR